MPWGGILKDKILPRGVVRPRGGPRTMIAVSCITALFRRLTRGASRAQDLSSPFIPDVEPRPSESTAPHEPAQARRGHAKRVEPPIVDIADAPERLPRETSENYIRRHLAAGFANPDLLAGYVRARFGPRRKTTREDVAFHWRKMAKEGIVGLPAPWFKRRPRRLSR
jgi:hypothetical protein